MFGPPGYEQLTVAQKQLLEDVQDAADYGTTDRMLSILAASAAPAGDRVAVERFLTGGNARPARLITDRDIRDQVAAVLNGCGPALVEGIDVDAVTAEIITRFGLVDVDAIDADVFWAIVAEHDATGRTPVITGDLADEQRDNAYERYEADGDQLLTGPQRELLDQAQQTARFGTAESILGALDAIDASYADKSAVAFFLTGRCL